MRRRDEESANLTLRHRVRETKEHSFRLDRHQRVCAYAALRLRPWTLRHLLGMVPDQERVRQTSEKGHVHLDKRASVEPAHLLKGACARQRKSSDYICELQASAWQRSREEFAPHPKAAARNLARTLNPGMEPNRTTK